MRLRRWSTARTQHELDAIASCFTSLELTRVAMPLGNARVDDDAALHAVRSAAEMHAPAMPETRMCSSFLRWPRSAESRHATKVASFLLLPGKRRGKGRRFSQSA